MILIDTKFLVFPQQLRCFDWHEAKFVVSKATPTSKWIPSKDLKKFVGRRTKSTKVNKNLINSFTACLLKETDAQICLYIVYKSALSVFSQELSVVVSFNALTNIKVS